MERLATHMPFAAESPYAVDCECVHAEPRQVLHAAAAREDGLDGVSFDVNAPEFSTDEFRMYHFKVDRCPKQRPHDWTQCPFSHAGERATRRDLRQHAYSGVACAEFRRASNIRSMLQTGACARGDECGFAHGVFESWLHPSKYKTQMCSDVKSCKRTVCFFAHSPEELRTPTPCPDTGSATCPSSAKSCMSVPAPTGANDVAAIAAAVEKLLGDKAGATVATRGQGMHPTPVPPPPPPPLHPVQQGSSALSSFLHSAAVLQQSLPGNDIMSLLQSALGGTAEHECYSGPPTPHTQQPLPLSARGMPGGMRAAHTPGCMRGTMPRPQVPAASPYAYPAMGRSSWSGAPYMHDADGRPPVPVPRMKSFSCTGVHGGVELFARPPPPLSVASGPTDESAYGPVPISARSSSISGCLSARGCSRPLQPPHKAATPPSRSPLTVDEGTPSGWSHHVSSGDGTCSQRDGSGSGVSDMSACCLASQHGYGLWGGSASLWSCAAHSRPASGSQQLSSEHSPKGDDVDDQFVREAPDSAGDPLLSKLPADLLNALANGHGAGKLADVTNQLAALH